MQMIGVGACDNKVGDMSTQIRGVSIIEFVTLRSWSL